jgi:hypothetical protein
MVLLTEESLQELYEIDDSLWLEKTILILKERRLEDLDIKNLIEELESLARNDKARVKSLLEQVIRHLLLLQYWQEEREYNAHHWRAEIKSFRIQLEDRLTTNLRNYLQDNFQKIYQDALEYVQEKTGFKVNFPRESPYTLEQLLDRNWL